MTDPLLEITPRHLPPLDPSFRPAALGNHSFLDAVRSSGRGVPLVIGLERNNGSRSAYRTVIFDASSEEQARQNLRYTDRLVKMLLWQKGGHKIVVGGPAAIGEHLKRAYAVGGERAFDAKVMGDVYEQPFTVDVTGAGRVPPENEQAAPKGKHLDGCRIGFDAGASDRKVAAVIDGHAVFSEEVVWNPKEEKNPQYHFNEITAAFKSAAAHLPRVDAIGVSSAGIYIDNRVMIASLFRGIPPDLFQRRVKGLFLELQQAWGGVPLEVCNDGEVTALCGAMNLNDGAVLGIAMGSSEAGGYVTPEGYLTEWLDELAFAPVDYNPGAAVDEWSGDAGCGAQYFAQTAAIRLAESAGIVLPQEQTPAEKLKTVQVLLDGGDRRARDIFESIGCYLGYTLAHYADFYDLRHVLILGRVTSGEGGNIVRNRAAAILMDEFPSLNERIKLHMPEEESERRVGQAIAAASLPAITTSRTTP